MAFYLAEITQFTQKEISRQLVEFLKENKINHWFGKDAFEIENRPGVYFVPRKLRGPVFGEWDGKIDFLSVSYDAAYKKNLPWKINAMLQVL